MGHPVDMDWVTRRWLRSARARPQLHAHQRQVFGSLVLLEHARPVGGGLIGGGVAVEVGDDALAQLLLELHGMRLAFSDRLLELVDFADGDIGEQLVVAPHEVVGDRHHLAEHFLRRFGDADVVAVGLRHLLHAVGAFEQRHGKHDLRRLVVVALELASHEQVEFLVGAAEFDVGLERHRVVALRDGVEQLVHGDGLLFGEALVEVLALEHLRDGELGGQAHEAFVAELVQPFAVEADFGFVAVENFEDLRLVGFGVGVDLLAGERRAGRRCGPRDRR